MRLVPRRPFSYCSLAFLAACLFAKIGRAQTPGPLLAAEAAPPNFLSREAISEPSRSRLPPLTRPQEDEPDRGDFSYHWRPLLLESFAFISTEDLFRVSTDNTLRSLTVNKPFWHDYIASLHQFNMRRWNDGDDFLVNYIGHPMQGAVSGYIEVQNSPYDSRIQWGERGYWGSRARALLWSTVYSTYSEIGPTGEAGLGNEGGFTYDLDCDLHCNNTTAKASGKETNNTGWVDFIVTPTAGTVWMVAEDFIDKKLTGPMVERSPDAVFPKILRGALSPTRTFANALRGRKPWYRDWDHPMIGDDSPSMHFEKAWENADGFLEGVPQWKRVEIAPHFATLSTTITTSHCLYCVQMTQGRGLQTSVKLWHWLYADTDVSYHPGASPLPSDRAGGNMVTGYFGVRGGYHTRNYALNLSLRPGFVQFHNAYLTSPPIGESSPAPTPQLGTVTHFAWNFMLAGDYKFGQHFAMRAGIGETLVRYRDACLDSSGIGLSGDLRFLSHNTPCQVSAGEGTAPYFTFLSHSDFISRGSWGVQIGPVVSF